MLNPLLLDKANTYMNNTDLANKIGIFRISICLIAPYARVNMAIAPKGEFMSGRNIYEREK